MTYFVFTVGTNHADYEVFRTIKEVRAFAKELEKENAELMDIEDEPFDVGTHIICVIRGKRIEL